MAISVFFGFPLCGAKKQQQQQKNKVMINILQLTIQSVRRVPRFTGVLATVLRVSALDVSPALRSWVESREDVELCEVQDDDTLRILHDGRGERASELYSCGCCEYRFASCADFSTVRTSRGRVSWCSTCADENAGVCADCQTLCEPLPYINDCREAICARCVESYGNCENCDRLVRLCDTESGECAACADRAAADVIPDYHTQKRPWRHLSSSAPLFGVELEICAKNSGDCAEIREIAEGAGMLVERDGSLDGEKGVEIVGSPMSLDDNLKAWVSLAAQLRRLASGWNAGSGYGMHISINRLAMTRLHQGKLLVFVNNSRELCEKVAGRKENSWAKFHRKIVRQGMDDSSGKYEALALRSFQRMECRIFRSTLAEKGIRRNLEFVAAAVEFSKLASLRLLENTGAFFAWLDEPAQSKRFEHLRKALKLRPATNPRSHATAGKGGK